MQSLETKSSRPRPKYLEAETDLRRPSETFGDLRRPSETFGDLRRPSETFGDLRRPSETFGDLRDLRPRLQKTGLETRLETETETKSRDSSLVLSQLASDKCFCIPWRTVSHLG